MAEHTAESDRPCRRWLGIRCQHETCGAYGICVVGPPLPTPPPPRVAPSAVTEEPTDG